VPTSGDATRAKRFQDARAKFLRDGRDAGEFRRIAEDYPADPIAPFAQLYAGSPTSRRASSRARSRS